MIYLVEDKTSRRNDYGWTDQRLSSFSDVITVVDNATKLFELITYIFDSCDVVLYHESFTKNESYDNERKIRAFIHSLEESQKIHIAYFSGSKTQRKNEGLICNLNYDPLYTNLNVFVKYYQQGTIDFDYLLFGENPEIENNLFQLIQKVNNENINIPTIESSYKILVYRTSENFIQFPILNSDKRDCDYDCSDYGLIKLIEDNSICHYDAIYIPLCMGDTLSDFLGLRLAMLYRLINTTNKYAHLFIYGVVNPLSFIKYECAEILKMPGVNYIPADGNSLKRTIQLIHKINDEEYRIGLKRIHLNVPTYIGDNHSVANKWAKYCWSLALRHSDSDIEKNNEEIYSSLYFKYLEALYPPTEMFPLYDDELIIKESSQIKPNILYIDDEADDGWYELLCHLIYDINHIKKFDYIGNELKSKTQNEIIDYVLEKIKTSDANIVVLDLRLHQNDFYDSNIQNITGYKLLKEIKHYNRGIQVLMFSATNKIWNLQALLKAEADGFIMKEMPNNSIDSHFTKDSIIHFIGLINNCGQHIYRKDLWPRIQKLDGLVRYHSKRLNINEKYANNVFTLLSMVENSLFDNIQNHSIDNAFIHLFTIIELTANEWIEIIEDRYSKKARFKESKDPLYVFDLKHKSIRPGKELYGNLDWGQKIANILYHVQAYDAKIRDLVDKRNNFTHPKGKLTYFSIDDIFNIFVVVEKIIINIRDN